jgi:hypothetical protein
MDQSSNFAIDVLYNTASLIMCPHIRGHIYINGRDPTGGSAAIIPHVIAHHTYTHAFRCATELCVQSKEQYM